jgi:hypothetical protein
MVPGMSAWLSIDAKPASFNQRVYSERVQHSPPGAWADRLADP